MAAIEKQRAQAQQRQWEIEQWQRAAQKNPNLVRAWENHAKQAETMGRLGEFQQGAASAQVGIDERNRIKSRGDYGGGMQQYGPPPTRPELGNLLNAGIPYAKQAAEAVGTGAGYASDALSAVESVPGLGTNQQVGQLTAEDKRNKSEAYGTAIGETVIPQEVWQAVLELVPGVGTIPDVVRAVKSGMPDALRALDNVLGSEAAQSVRQKLASERGAIDPEMIRSSIVERIRGNAFARQEMEAIRSEEIAGKSAAVGRAFEESKSPDELIAQLKAARSGKLAVGEFEPFTFPSEEKAWMIDQIWKAPQSAVIKGPLSRANAVDAILRMESGDGLRPFEERLWTDIFGEEFVQAVKERGSNSILASIARMWETPRAMGPTDAPVAVLGGDKFLPAVDEAVTGAVNRNMLKHQMEQGAKPEWKYADEQAKAALQSDEPLKELTLLQRGLSPIQLWRSFKTSFDNSFLGRQGWRLVASNPVEWAGAWKRSWKAMMSDDALAAIMDDVTSAPNYALGQRLKRPLAIVTEGGGDRPAEEFLARTPRWMRPFERAYMASANYVRQMSFESNLRSWSKANKGQPVPDHIAQKFSDNINNATLYGNLSAVKEDQHLLGQTFFSLRAKASLPQFLLDTAKAMRPGTDPTVRRIFAQRLGGWLSLNMALLYGVKYSAGATGAGDADLNPFSPTFGRIKFGPKTFDVWGGYAPLVRLIIGAGAAANELRQGDTPDRNPSELSGRYIANQLSPAGRVAYDFTFGGGKDFRGKDLYDKENAARYGLEQVSPIFLTEVWDAWEADGFTGAGVIGAATFLGIGAGAYQPSEAQQTREVQSAAAKAIEKLGARVIEKRPWPEQLDKDWSGPAWNQLFKREFPELGSDLSKYPDKEAAKKAYVDYWWDQKGLNGAPSEAERRDIIGSAFDKSEFSKKWTDNVSLERLNWLDKLTPAQLAEVRKTYQLTVGEKKALGVD